MPISAPPTDIAPGTTPDDRPSLDDDLGRSLATLLGPPAIAAVSVVALDPPIGVAVVCFLVAAGVSSWLTVRHTVRPLTAAVATSRAEQARLQMELVAEHADQHLRARLERALRNAGSEPESLRIGLRAVAEAVPDSEVTLLLNLPDEPRIGWRVGLTGGELDAAVPVPGTPGCSALAEGTPVVAMSSSLEACAHLHDLGAAVSAACVPLQAGERTMGAVCIATAPGEPLDARTLERVEWIVERTGLAAGGHRSGRGAAHAAPTDALTGLPGPTALRPHLREMVRSLSPFCLAVIEIDHFEELEDRDDADAALVLVAEALCNTVRPDDMVCRLEGSGFAATLRDCDDSEAVAVMERVREAVVLLLTEDPALHISCSTGVVGSGRATSLEQIVEFATAACDDARAAGGNRVAVFEWSDQRS